ncbi:hypothetical protein A2U01_0117878, partial [Trifolium medium]|nr:hypothetical protein [Trifolium medium]
MYTPVRAVMCFVASDSSSSSDISSSDHVTFIPFFCFF